MDVNSKVESALSSICQIWPNVCPSKPKPTEYMTYNYADERPELNADDTDVLDSTTIQVHYFTKGNPQANKKAIRKALRSADFAIQSTQELYEQDTGYTHVIVYAVIGGEIDD